MSIRVDNQYLEAQIAREAELRGHKSKSRTLEELAAERLRDLHHERRMEQAGGRVRRTEQPAA